jgi:hypothetical protein
MTNQRRGAPNGNRNAWKHGFYSSTFHEHEHQLFAESPGVDLTAEIALLRIANLRTMQALDSSPADFEAELSALRALTLSIRSITTLIRTRSLALELGGLSLDDLTQTLQDALHDDPSSGDDQPLTDVLKAVSQAASAADPASDDQDAKDA